LFFFSEIFLRLDIGEKLIDYSYKQENKVRHFEERPFVEKKKYLSNENDQKKNKKK
jgi:hypothetical protein